MINNYEYLIKINNNIIFNDLHIIYYSYTEQVLKYINIHSIINYKIMEEILFFKYSYKGTSKYM